MGAAAETSATDRDGRPDVVILGAGINGAALARELVLNDASVVVVDADDVASGTTRWSTRLVHGGLRYLEYGEVGLVRESLRERGRLVRLAPHLVRPLGFYVPLRRRLGGLRAAAARVLGFDRLARRFDDPRGRGAIAVDVGLRLYDLLALGTGWPRHRMVRAGGEGAPRVDRQRYPLAALYDDARMPWPERFTVELLVDAARIAAERGLPFVVHTRRVARIAGDGGMRLECVHGTRHALPIAPRALVNATGAWVDRTNERLLPAAPRPRPLVGGTKGSHLLVDHEPLRAALGERAVYAEAEDGRPVFVIPSGRRRVLVGTTDIPFSGDPAAARASGDEIDYLLGVVATLFPDAAPPPAAVVVHYSGVRPLPAADGAPAGITRRHLLVPLADMPVPAWAIVGGKLTTCRSLAEEAAARVLARLGRRVTANSRERPLPGACAPPDAHSLAVTLAAVGVRAGRPADEAGRSAAATVALLGTRAAGVFDLVERAPGGERAAWLEPLPGVDLPAAVVPFCLAEEWACSLADLVERRLVLPFEQGFSPATVRAVAAAMVRAGALDAGSVDGEVAALLSGLVDRHGLRFPPAD